jgi:amino acid transporter
MGAASLGPAQMLAWLAAGVLAALIAIAFVQCAAVDTEVGGSYAYARLAFGPFVGFMAGWTLYAGEWVALSAFPKAFFNYFQAFTGAPDSLGILVKVLLVVAVTAVNVVGVRSSARTNDVLTLVKLLPLVALMILGLAFFAVHPGRAEANLEPFAPVGWSEFGKAVLPIFWAFAGFELAVLPAGEVRSPGKTLPRGLLMGASIATVIYLLTTFSVVISLPWQAVQDSRHPLALAMSELVRQLGGPADVGERLMSLGGLISIAGVFIVFTLGLARLSFALAKDGFFPSRFARLHPRFDTPYVGILFQAGSALLGSTLFQLRPLLSTAVLFLSICYLLTSLSALRFIRRDPARSLHLPGLRLVLGAGAIASLLLFSQATTQQFAVCAAVVLSGVALYASHARHWHARASSANTS